MTERIYDRVQRLVKWFFLFYLFTFLPLSTFAQQMLTGAITDAQTGEAIPFASVQYKGHNLGVVSNIEGHYSIARHHDCDGESWCQGCLQRQAQSR